MIPLLENINEVAIVGTALVMLAFSTAWYDFFELVPKKKAWGVTEFAQTALCYIIAIALLAYGSYESTRAGISVYLYAITVAVFSLALFGSIAVVEKKPLRAYLLHAGFISIFIVCSTLCVYYWPW